MESLSNDKIVSYLREVEASAEEVLAAKQEVVDLDRKRNQNREALRSLEKESASHWKGQDAKTWIAVGGTFLQIPYGTAKGMLEKDQVRLNTQINVTRSELKEKVYDLRDKEGQSQLKGFDLKALSKDDMDSVREAIGRK